MDNDRDAKNILLIKPGAIGDLLQLTPVIRALAARYPQARLTLMVGSHTTATLFRHNPSVAEIIVFDRREEHRSFSSLVKLWGRLRRSKFDLVIHFQRSNLKTWFLLSAALPCRVLVYRKTRNTAVHVVDNYLDTLVPLDIVGRDRHLEFFTGGDDDQFSRDLLSRNGCNGKLVIALNPGASHPVNRWPAKRFAELADLLADRLSAKIIIIGGTEDASLADAISSATRCKPIILSGKATLLQLGAVLRQCDLLISGDTGPLHIATAVGTRVVALFGAADPVRTGPVGTDHRVIQAKGVPCVPCRSRTCNNSIHLECMEKISSQEVTDAVTEMTREKQSTSA